ncbi:hypothetical protein, partial [Roseomonas sp. KE2513]|uniref:hypothetical protein n=1 Tax=Roseomonas sp. KE2513 TaxID=2479202 RepID=UPI001E55B1AA
SHHHTTPSATPSPQPLNEPQQQHYQSAAQQQLHFQKTDANLKDQGIGSPTQTATRSPYPATETPPWDRTGPKRKSRLDALGVAIGILFGAPGGGLSRAVR